MKNIILSTSLILTTAFVSISFAHALPHKGNHDKGKHASKHKNHCNHCHHSHFSIKEMDQNQDGVIDQKEYKTALENKFKQKDYDKDGYITSKDLASYKQKKQKEMQAKRTEKMQERFKKADKNHDQKISKKEFMNARPKFKEMDINKDGVLSKTEFKNTMKLQYKKANKQH